MSAFKTLGVSEDATQDEVKAKWRELASIHHPDRGGDPAEFHKYRRAYKQAMELAPEVRITRCPSCGGSGKKKVTRGFYEAHIMCADCRGSGHAT